MKRVLAFILVLSMVLGSVGMVFADSASDIAGHKNEKAILRLNNLGIVEGDDRGFAPDDYITRAEFAVLVVRALGLEGSANVSKGDTAFTDVTVAGGYEWASGAINVATKLGYIQGYGGGLFGPADNIRYEDAITLIVRVLGYEPVVQTKGGYPVGYLVVAEQDLDITDHVDGVVGVPITRGAIFQLLDNALTKALMIQVGYGDDARFVISGTERTDKQTILTDRLGLELVEGIVTQIARVSSLKSDRIRIDNKVYKVVGDVDYEEVFGTEVEAWLNDDDEAVYVEIVSDEIYLDAVEWNSAKAELKLVDAGTKYDLARNVKIFIDGKNDKGVKDLGEKYDYAKVVLDDDGDVSFIDAYNWDDCLVVEEIDGYDIFGYGDELDAEDFTIVKDGKTIALEDIEEDDIVFYNSKAEYAEVFISTVEGEIEEIFRNEFEVAGKSFDYFNEDLDINVKYINEDGDIDDFDKDAAEQMQDEESDVVVFMDRAGNAVFVDGDLGEIDKSTSGAILYEDATGYLDTRGRAYIELKVVNESGKAITYDVALRDLETIEIDGKEVWDDDKNALEASSDEGFDFDEITYDLGENGGVIVLPGKGEVVEIIFNEKGDVIGLGFFDSDHFSEAESGDKYIEGARMNSSVPVFIVKDGWNEDDNEMSTDWDKDDVEATTYGELDDGIKLNEGDVYLDGRNAAYLVVFSSDFEDTSKFKGVVTQVRENSKNELTRVRLLINDKEETFYVDDPSKFKDADIDRGIAIEIEVYDNNDRIKNIFDEPVEGPFDVKEDGLNVKTRDKEIEIADEIYELVSDGYIYDVTKKSDIKKMSLTELGRVEAGTITLFLDKDGTHFVKYVLFDKSGVVANNGDNGDDNGDEAVVGVVTYINVPKTQLVINNIIYKADEDTIVKDVDGSIIGLGSFEGINQGDKVSVDGDVYTILEKAAPLP